MPYQRAKINKYATAKEVLEHLFGVYDRTNNCKCQWLVGYDVEDIMENKEDLITVPREIMRDNCDHCANYDKGCNMTDEQWKEYEVCHFELKETEE